MEKFSHGNLDYRAKGRLFFCHCTVTMMKLSPKNDTLQNSAFRGNRKYFAHYSFFFENAATQGAFPGALTPGKRCKGV